MAQLRPTGIAIPVQVSGAQSHILSLWVTFKGRAQKESFELLRGQKGGKYD